MSFLKDEFLSLLKRIVKSKDNLTLFVMNFSFWALIAAEIVILNKKLFDLFSFSSSVEIAVRKAIICITPVIPTLRIWSMREMFGGDSGVNDGVMDCCFSAWIIIILFAQII